MVIQGYLANKTLKIALFYLMLFCNYVIIPQYVGCPYLLLCVGQSWFIRVALA